MTALVSDEDYLLLPTLKWFAKAGNGNKFYAYSNRFGNLGRYLLNTPSDMIVDHKDGNTLNYQRNNIRNCTWAQNMQNQVRTGEGYKGVYINKRGLLVSYTSYITHNSKQIYLGCFDTETEAAKAYNEAAIKYFGEFANINIIKEVYDKDEN
jgi:hypothetical protein